MGLACTSLRFTSSHTLCGPGNPKEQNCRDNNLIGEGRGEEKEVKRSKRRREKRGGLKKNGEEGEEGGENERNREDGDGTNTFHSFLGSEPRSYMSCTLTPQINLSFLIDPPSQPHWS